MQLPVRRANYSSRLLSVAVKRELCSCPIIPRIDAWALQTLQFFSFRPGPPTSPFETP